MTLKVGVDFDLNGWVDVWRSTGDANNLFGASAADIDGLQRAVTSGAITVAAAALYDEQQWQYGINRLDLIGFAATERLAIGWDGASTYDITGQASGTYSAAVYAATPSGKATIRLRIISSGGTSVTGSSVALSSTLQQVTVSGSLPHAAQSIRLEVESVSGTSAVAIYAPMIVAGSTIPTALNCGTDGQYEDITPYVMSARWRTGFVRPYQTVAGRGRATFNLVNTDKRFSPEAGHALWTADNLARNDQLVRVFDDTDVLWTGFVDAWTPQSGTVTGVMATLEAVDGFKFVSDTEIFPDLKTSANPSTLIQHVIDLVEASARVVLTLDGYAVTYVSDVDLLAIESETVPYYFDQTPNESEARGQQAASLFDDILKGIAGKLWWTRGGWLKAAGPAEDGGAVAATFNDTAISVDYQWAQNIVNECTVKAYPRLYDAFGTLWRLRESVTVDAGATEIVRAYFTRPGTDTRCGADNTTVVLNNLTYSGAGIAATITDIDAMSCEISVVNSSGGSRNMTDARVQGNPLLARDAISRTRGDGTSLTRNGRHAKTIDSRWVAKGKWAKRLAQYIVNRFKDARGEVVSITGNYGADSQFADCYIGRKVRVADTQLGHDENYIVIGEDHRWEPGSDSYNHVVKLYLELADTTTVGTTSV